MEAITSKNVYGIKEYESCELAANGYVNRRDSRMVLVRIFVSICWFTIGYVTTSRLLINRVAE